MELNPENHYRVDSHNVVHETIEGEVIVIHLLNGSYYSLGGGGPEIWRHLLDGARPEAIAAAVPADGADPAEVREAVFGFISSLAEDELVAAVPGDENGRVPERAAGAWLPPVFERYTDMKDYFLLDPIHEVDASGWPNRQAD